ncbi:MAG: hypothetical protein JXB47_10280 [Anaerolineae bacterium]|nr:hypothetical protein [Anaerolineae bacterium]
MPQLLTRMDDAGWLTPAIAEVLAPLPPRPFDDAAVAEQARAIERAAAEAQVPVRIMGRGALPSHTMFVVQPGEVGRLRNRREVTLDQVREALPKLAEALDAEVDILPHLDRAPDAFGLLVRYAEHRPLVLRSLLMQPGFQESAAPTTLALGINLQQVVVARDLVALRHLLILGAGAPKTHYIHSLLVTLLLFNTPAELQLALVGGDPAGFQPYLGMPHLVGRPLSGLEAGRVALQRMAKEVNRREALFKDAGADDLEAYNARLRASGAATLPRTLLVIDPVSDPEWTADPQGWAPALGHYLDRGARTGMHALVTAQAGAALPPGMLDLFGARLVLRSAGGELAGLDLADVPLKFVDALLVEGDQAKATPVGQCAAPSDDIASLKGYWQQAAQKHTAAAPAGAPDIGAVSGAGLTGEPEGIVTDISGDIVRPASEMEVLQDVILPRARALAAYLGWLSAGPLRDILGVNERQAETIMRQLREEGLLEPKLAPALRFRRLSEPPETGPAE